MILRTDDTITALIESYRRQAMKYDVQLQAAQG